MKIVQSFWSKPSIEKENHRWAGGWPGKKYNYLCWAFSCLQLRRYYEHVELVTDHCGKHLLIDKLKLPYSNVRVVLDDLEFPTELWAFGKIEACRIQKVPFLHVDNDVFIWKKFGSKVEKASVVVQSEEFFAPKLEDLSGKVDTDLKFLPDSYRSVIRQKSYIPNYNMGIIGGTDLDFFQDYTTTVFDCARAQMFQLPKLEASFINVIFEQFFLFMMTKRKGLDVACLFDKSYLTEIYRKGKFREFIRDHKYFHVHYLKRKHRVAEMLERWMQLYHPEYYYSIIHHLQYFSL